MSRTSSQGMALRHQMLLERIGHRHVGMIAFLVG